METAQLLYSSIYRTHISPADCRMICPTAMFVFLPPSAATTNSTSLYSGIYTAPYTFSCLFMTLLCSLASFTG
ncbi:hypothetical protein BDQ12DRAFT_694156 [Crucibulum laeve]|uniref:Uncharacterized protein n=1 Tax=Crucibulum laeve TaxID=68775 RepID=A0A5C3LEC6_9AGAR|nr:hypothetical protein BDQ12DRAFT_694156 [Crucibulum laeve]